MEISFTADFRDRKQDYVDATTLNDAFSTFLPVYIKIERLEIKWSESPRRSGNYYKIKMKTGKLYTIKEIKNTLKERGILMKDVRSVMYLH